MTNPPKLPNQKKKKKPTATEVLVANLSVPGTGTMLAGQKLHGACQLVTSVIGFMMTIYFAGWFIMEWSKTGVFPVEALNAAGRIPESWIMPMLVGVGGVFVFITALGWAFLTSLVVRGQMNRNDPNA